MNSQKIKEYIQAGAMDSRLQRVYANEEDMTAQRVRYIGLVEDYEDIFGNDADLRFFSAPGRTEVCGNHTDHNRGKVLAAGINL
nr:galactokinase family protein [Clostridiales bacterium]